VLRETTTRGLCALVFPSRTSLSLCAIPITKLFLLQTCSRVFDYYLQLLDATSEGTTPTKLKGGLTMARNGLRTRPPVVDPRATDCDGRWIPLTSIPHRTLILLARASAQYPLPRPRNGNFAHAGRSDCPRNLLELQALHPSQQLALVLYCSDLTITLLHTGRSLDHHNPTVSCNTMTWRDLGF